MALPAIIHRVVTPPTEPAATLEQLKLHARIETDDEDTELERLLLAATSAVENECRGLALVDRTIEVLVSEAPVGDVALPVRPARTLEQVATYAADGTETVVDLDGYLLRPDHRVQLANGTLSWPVFGERLYGGLGLRYVAGYGPTAATVPHELQQAVLALATYWADNREASSARHLPDSVRGACDPFRRFDHLGRA